MQSVHRRLRQRARSARQRRPRRSSCHPRPSCASSHSLRTYAMYPSTHLLTYPRTHLPTYPPTCPHTSTPADRRDAGRRAPSTSRAGRADLPPPEGDARRPPDARARRGVGPLQVLRGPLQRGDWTHNVSCCVVLWYALYCSLLCHIIILYSRF